MASASSALLELSVGEFLERLGSRQPTPGGGAAAALAGALAAALGRMVCAYTVGKPKFAAVQTHIVELTRRLEHAAEMLSCLIDDDAAAYQQLADALKLDKADPHRGPRVRAAADLAASVPFQTVAVCRAVLADVRILRGIGNPTLKSDAHAGAHLARAACLSAAENVRANFGLMSPDAAARLEPELNRLVADAEL